MSDHRPLAVVIGMPGAGKTRVGREAAQILDVDFTDTDIEIEKEIGMKISRYFDQYGERAFRKLESQTVINLLESCEGLLALGGGAPMNVDIREALADYTADGGKVVYLEADKREAMERASRSGNRPMLNGDADKRWMKLYEERDPVFHDIANLRVRTHGSTPRMAARKLSNMIREHIVHVTGSDIEPYDVCIGEGALNRLVEIIGDDVLRIALIHTQSVQRHSDQARALLRQAGYEVHDMVIPDAESGKTVDVAKMIWKQLGERGFTRSDAIIGLGGGATTDFAGFMAATWMRGIRYVNCPTSLLAMVDASTGGKTGINTEEGKNLVGSFYTPAGVLADLRALKTLPRDIFIEGLGEVAKSGFIRDAEILEILRDYAEDLRNFDGDAFLGSSLEDVVSELIKHTVRVKVYHVSNDLKETGLREF